MLEVCVYVLTIEEETSKHTIRTRAENLADTMVAIRRTSTEGARRVENCGYEGFIQNPVYQPQKVGTDKDLLISHVRLSSYLIDSCTHCYALKSRACRWLNVVAVPSEQSQLTLQLYPRVQPLHKQVTRVVPPVGLW